MRWNVYLSNAELELKNLLRDMQPCLTNLPFSFLLYIASVGFLGDQFLQENSGNHFMAKELPCKPQQQVDVEKVQRKGSHRLYLDDQFSV